MTSDKERIKSIKKWITQRFKEADRLSEIGMLDYPKERALFYCETLDGIEIILRRK
ncbi:hypothetical protein LCGC14_0556310 [marine sediment metagenome]|uniref:Uncharacterized protein n=1 Tax=marine sediment metagenome TaxID=412755 RepID=A0A0F9UWG4_9ZZZZ